MANYRIAFNKNTKIALVQLAATAIPSGSVAVGTFEHAAVENSINDLEFDHNHVIFQHVRDALYKRSRVDPTQTAKFPNNITDMAGIQIKLAAGVSLKHPSQTEGSDA